MLDFHPAVDFKLLLAVPLIPLVGYALQIFLRKRLPFGDKLLTAGMFAVMAITVFLGAKALAAAFAGEEFAHHSEEAGLVFRWFYQSADVAAAKNVVAGIYFDGLGAAMLAVVGIVSFCVHLFSVGYMHGDRRYHIFFANISLFTFAMLGLVLSDNLLFLFIFWEIMGLMSYLLIGHFAHDPDSPRIRQAASACKKAFLTTRIGDVCLFIGMMMFYHHFETFRFTELWEATRETVAANGGDYPGWMTVAGLFVFGGTVGKSAQFPLHIWLPDAMEGPTPVSAMIHAATMVAAGVFLLGRTYPMLSPEVLAVVTVVGATTALFAATIGTTVFDIKGVLAYSTISQLGFMVAAVGLGGVVAGMFHMVTHAFFKACLFLSAGSVIRGCHHEQDMRRMGGLRRYMPVTFACMTICTLAIAGVPLFAGFYSKDQIVQAGFLGVMNKNLFSGWTLFALIALAAAAALTAFYMFRLIFMTFFGEYRGRARHPRTEFGHEAIEHGHLLPHGVERGDEHEHEHGHAEHVPHESPLPMTLALGILAFLGIFGGHFWLLGSPFGGQAWFNRLTTVPRLYGEQVGGWIEARLARGYGAVDLEHLEHAAHGYAVATSLAVAGLGILLAWFLYVRRRDLPGRIAAALGLVYETVRDKYYVDEAVNATVVRPTMASSRAMKWVDEHVVDGLVLLVGRVTRSAGFLSAWFDRTFVDGLVNAVALVSQGFGSIARLLQTGRIQQYAAFAVAGALLTAAWLILS
jgi:NADH-quinone oxidoreductase subunit L